MTTQELTHIRTGTRQRKDVKRFLHGIETHQRIRAEVAEPHPVLIVHIERIGARVLARQLPFLPRIGGGVIAAHLPSVPFADPDVPLRIRPHPARALLWRRRLDHGGGAGDRVKTRDVTARQRRIVYGSIRRGGNSVRPRALRRVEHLHFADLGIQPPVDAALAGEPQHTALIKGSGVQVRAFTPGRQRIDGDFLRRGLDAHDGVQAAVRDPRRAVRADDHTVRL